jgi:hypothetical protein
MLRAYNYFTEIIENLQIIGPEIYPSYPIGPPEKKQVTLKQIDYKFNFDNGKNPRQIDILCHCVLEQPLEFHVPTKDEAIRYTTTLESYNFPFHCKNLLDKSHSVRGALFRLEGPMKAHIRIIARPEDKRIHINLRNIEDQPIKSYKLSPDLVDDALLERLARMLIREELQLVEVKVCDKVRDELRRRIEVEKRQKEDDLAQAYASLESERSAQNNARLVNRAKKAAVAGAGSFIKVFSKS